MNAESVYAWKNKARVLLDLGADGRDPVLVAAGSGTDRGQASVASEGRRRGRRDTGARWLLVLIAILCGGSIRHLRTVTGSAMLDGSMDPALGPYVCSRPVSGALDVLFFEREGGLSL